MHKRFVAWLGLALLVIALDQWSKFAVVNALMLGETKAIFPGFNIVMAHNPGAAFSMLASQSGWQRHFFTVLAVLVSLYIVHLLRKHASESRFAFALAFIMGGALGNVIDRVRLGYVIDFIQIYYHQYSYPAFNLADSAICVGAVLIVLDNVFKSKTPAPDAR